jgi:hypothetical protein
MVGIFILLMGDFISPSVKLVSAVSVLTIYRVFLDE